MSSARCCHILHPRVRVLINTGYQCERWATRIVEGRKYCAQHSAKVLKAGEPQKPRAAPAIRKTTKTLENPGNLDEPARPSPRVYLVAYTFRAASHSKSRQQRLYVAASSAAQAIEIARAEVGEFLAKDGPDGTWTVIGAPSKVVLDALITV
jgi:hypothetical protein